MLSSLVGAVIMSSVTVAMLIAVNVVNKGSTNLGKFPLNDEEIDLLKEAGWRDPLDIQSINDDIREIDFDEQ